MAEASQWLEEYRAFWERRFQKLDALLEEMKAEAAPRRKAKRARRTPKTKH